MVFTEFFLGLFFIGTGVSTSKTPEGKYVTTLDYFKVIFGLVLIILAIFGGVAKA